MTKIPQKCLISLYIYNDYIMCHIIKHISIIIVLFKSNRFVSQIMDSEVYIHVLFSDEDELSFT